MIIFNHPRLGLWLSSIVTCCVILATFENDAHFVDATLRSGYALDTENQHEEATISIPLSQEEDDGGMRKEWNHMNNSHEEDDHRGLQQQGFNPLEIGPQVRIVNGQDVPQDRFTWFVRVLGAKNGGSSFGACGGSLIAPDVAITAAHCDFASRVIVNPYNVDEVNESNRRELVQIVPHPNYPQELILEYDVMLLKFDSPITDYEPVMLNFDNNVPSETGEELLILGFGSTIGGKETAQEDPPNEQSTILLQAPTEYVSFDDCAVAADPDTGFSYGRSPENTQVTDSWFCTMKTDPMTSTCFGDSGGPIIVEGSQRQSDLLVAVISGASGYCGNPYLPLWNQRVSYHKDWILEVGCQLSAKPPAYWNCGGATGGGSTGDNTTPDDGGSAWVPEEGDGGSAGDTTPENGGDSTGSPQEGGGGGSAGVVVGIVVVLLVLAGVGFLFWKRRRAEKDPGPDPDSEKRVDDDNMYLAAENGDIVQPHPDSGPTWLDTIKNAVGASGDNTAISESGKPTLIPFIPGGNDASRRASHSATDDSSDEDPGSGQVKRKSSWLPSRKSFVSNDIEAMVNKLDKELDDACKPEDKEGTHAAKADRGRSLSRERPGAGNFAENSKRGSSTSIERSQAANKAEGRRSLSKDRSSATDHAAARGLSKERSGVSNHAGTRGRSSERTGASHHADTRGRSNEPAGASCHADTRGRSKEPIGASNHAGTRGRSKEPATTSNHADTRGRSKEPATTSNHAGTRGRSKEPIAASNHADSRGRSKEPVGASRHAGIRGPSKEPASNHAGTRGRSTEPTGTSDPTDSRGRSKEPAGASNRGRSASKQPSSAIGSEVIRGRSNSKDRSGASDFASKRGQSLERNSGADNSSKKCEPAGRRATNIDHSATSNFAVKKPVTRSNSFTGVSPAAKMSPIPSKSSDSVNPLVKVTKDPPTSATRSNSFRRTPEGYQVPPAFRSKSVDARAAPSTSSGTKGPVDPAKATGESKLTDMRAANTRTNSFKAALGSQPVTLSRSNSFKGTSASKFAVNNKNSRFPPARTHSADMIEGASSKGLPARSNSNGTPSPTPGSSSDTTSDRKVIVNSDGSIVVEQKRTREDGAIITTKTKYANAFLARKHGIKV
jgi:secreted trypsin-like serine protease